MYSGVEIKPCSIKKEHINKKYLNRFSILEYF